MPKKNDSNKVSPTLLPSKLKYPVNIVPVRASVNKTKGKLNMTQPEFSDNSNLLASDLVLARNQPKLEIGQPESASNQNWHKFNRLQSLIIGLGLLIIIASAAFIPLSSLQSTRLKLEMAAQVTEVECLKFLESLTSEADAATMACPSYNPTNLKTLSFVDLIDRVRQLEVSYQADKTKLQDSQVKAEQAKQRYREQWKIIHALGDESFLEGVESETRQTSPKFSEIIAENDLITNQIQKRLRFYQNYINTKQAKLILKQAVIDKLGLVAPIQNSQLLATQVNFSVFDIKSPTDARRWVQYSIELTAAIESSLAVIHAKTDTDLTAKGLATVVEVGGESVELPILTYHRLEDINALPENLRTLNRRLLTVHPDTFRRQLDLIQQKGYQTVSLSDVEQAFTAKNKQFFNRKIILLTFDDGYLEHYNVAFPELQKRGMQGVFGVVTSYLQPKSKTNMSWDMVRQMDQAGMQIISHSVSHCSLGSYKIEDGRRNPDGGGSRACDLSQRNESEYGQVGKNMMPVEQMTYETGVSQRELKQQLGKPARYFMYPYGSYNDQVLDTLVNQGYDLGLIVGGGPVVNLDLPLELNRITIKGEVDPANMGKWFDDLARND